MRLLCCIVLLLVAVAVTTVHGRSIAGPPPEIEAVNQTCIRYIGSNTLEHCSPAGATGPAPTISPVNSSCVSISGVGSATLCNPPGVLPGYYIVDGITYAQTRAGVQAALNAAAAAGGGTVLLTSDIVSDCTPLLLQSRVILNGQEGRRYAIKAPASATGCDMVTNGGTGAGTTTTLLVNATRGATNVTVPEPALSEIAAATDPKFVVLQGCGIDSNPGTVQTYHRVCGVDTVASTVILCWPLPYDCRTDLSASIRLRTTTHTGSGIKHVTLDVNGNTAANLRLMRLLWQHDFTAEDIVLTGDYTNALSAVFAVSFDGFWDGHIKNIRTSDTFRQSASTLIFHLRGLEASTVSDVRLSNSGGFGITLSFSHNSVLENIYVNRHTGTGLRFEASAAINVFGLHSSGHLGASGNALLFRDVSHQNSIIGMNAIGSAARHVATSHRGDNNNVFLGMQSYGSAVDDFNFATGSEGNMIMGSRWFKGYTVGTVYKNFVQGVPYNSGLNSFTITEPATPAATDMQFNGAMSFTFHNESYIGMNVRTRAGTLKRVLFELTPY